MSGSHTLDDMDQVTKPGSHTLDIDATPLPIQSVCMVKDAIKFFSPLRKKSPSFHTP